MINENQELELELPELPELPEVELPKDPALCSVCLGRRVVETVQDGVTVMMDCPEHCWEFEL